MLELKNLTVKIGQKKIISNLNYSFSAGKIYMIMGPNGSGKSTLARVKMGDPQYQLVKESQIVFNNQSILSLTADERAKKGIFMSFQFPLSLSGINLYQLLRVAMEKKIDPLLLRKRIITYGQELELDKQLLSRSLNEGASGGEKKKLEAIQAAILQPKLAIFDEIDTGVDIDGLKLISAFLSRHRAKTTYLLISHHNRVLRYLNPDRVLVLVNGKISRSGDYKLVQTIEDKGYRSFYEK